MSSPGSETPPGGSPPSMRPICWVHGEACPVLGQAIGTGDLGRRLALVAEVMRALPCRYCPTATGGEEQVTVDDLRALLRVAMLERAEALETEAGYMTLVGPPGSAREAEAAMRTAKALRGLARACCAEE